MGVKEDRIALSRDLIAYMGGEANIAAAAHCYTRLRLTAKDPSKIDEDAIQKRDGVLGLVKRNGQYQVVVGPEATDLYHEFVQLGEFESAGGAVDEQAAAEDAQRSAGSAEAAEGGRRGRMTGVLDFIGGTFSPVIPVLIAGGLTGAVLTVLTNFFHVADASGTYQVFYAVNQAAFYFLPVFIGFSAARKLNVDGYLGAFLGTVLLYETINGAEGLTFADIPVAQVTYNTTVFPIILGTWFMSVAYRFFVRLLPGALRAVFLPLLTMLVTVPVTLLALGPIGNVLGGWLASGVTAVYEAAPPLAVLVIGATTPFLVFFGMNNALYPVIFALFESIGGDPLVMAGMLAANVSVGAACIAVGIGSREVKTKSVAISAGITGLLGITEPGVYGVLFPLRRPLIAAVIGGGAGGLLAGLLGTTQYVIASPSFASLPAYIPADGSMSNFYGAIGVAVFSVVVAFTAAWLLGTGRNERTPQAE
ncbi:PTS transporter subunit EIIC [Actinomyces qiguomingii]|uniref:PTS transporter subunit EIIC n=1 Tax=Actinomyces qiguomingii TaxID=2057800 RepID=UPI000CA073BF|nr:PTS transporter subunit EIIC [Actinomyces qiguomingii]